MYKLQIQNEAILEMQEAYDWYESQKRNLGYELLDEVESCLQKLEQHPQYYSRLNNRYKRIKTIRFPYLLIFEIEEKSKTIYIVSFFHTSRNPKKKYRGEE